MVLTRRAYKAISRWLPNEIITEIIQAAPQSDQASLCRVSKLFHGLCLPLLYRAVRLKTRSSIEAFCAAVLSNNALAELVRSFTAGFRIGLLTPQTSLTTVNSSKALLRLECLSIDISSLQTEHLRQLLHSTFPYLVHCSLGTHDCHHWSSQELDYTLVSFLLRHPALQTLHIQDWDRMEVWPSSSTRIPLLHLHQLQCPFRLVPSIFTGSLKNVGLDWFDIPAPNEVEKTFGALKSMARTDIPFICSNTTAGPSSGVFMPEILNSLSRNIPHTRTLQLEYANDDKVVIRCLMDCLPSFTGLAFLSLECWFPAHSGAQDEDLQTVQAFGEACSTLEGCRLHKCAWRKVAGMWEKYPVEDFMVLAGILTVQVIPF
ncbi:hypothetical protein FB451DRAFT_393759 [Mycena latifolia]|nr:hypothetical protein FB451DRAFT_393759 [Mycena latifolia]